MAYYEPTWSFDNYSREPEPFHSESLYEILEEYIARSKDLYTKMRRSRLEDLLRETMTSLTSTLTELQQGLSTLQLEQQIQEESIESLERRFKMIVSLLSESPQHEALPQPAEIPLEHLQTAAEEERELAVPLSYDDVIPTAYPPWEDDWFTSDDELDLETITLEPLPQLDMEDTTDGVADDFCLGDLFHDDATPDTSHTVYASIEDEIRACLAADDCTLTTDGEPDSDPEEVIWELERLLHGEDHILIPTPSIGQTCLQTPSSSTLRWSTVVLVAGSCRNVSGGGWSRQQRQQGGGQD